MDWKAKAKALKAQGKSWKDIADELMEDEEFKGLDAKRRWERVRTIQPRSPKTAVGVIGDLHIPFDHPNYLQFLKDTFKKYRVGQVVSIGDLVDHHAMSRHQTETCARGAVDELDMSINRLKNYVKVFPKVLIVEGNHDSIVRRQAATVNVDTRYLKPILQVLELPKTWTMADEYLIDDVLYKHGINCGGKDGALNTAIQERMSTVIGHYHSGGGCKYNTNKRNIIFGLNVGCGIDISAYAFAYGTHAKYRPTLGCGIVFSASNAIFVPMGSEYFRD